MKSKKRLLFVLGLIAVGIGSWLWMMGEDISLEQAAAPVDVEQARPATEDRVVTPQMYEPQYLKVASGDEDFTPAQREKMRELGLPEAVVRRALQAIASNLAPVDFHLKIIDQNGDPVPGAKIEYDVNRSPGFGGPGTYFGQSDVGGRFEVTGTKAARVLLVKFTKPGYVFRPIQDESNVAAMNEKHLYTADAPLIVHVWKLGKPAKLLENDGRNKSVQVPNDGSWTSLYLVSDRRLVKKEGKQPDADLWVSVVARVKNPGMKFEHPMGWSMVLETPNGGFQKADDRFMYLAPESGYESHLEVSYKRSEPGWAGWTYPGEKFYLLLRNRKTYGRMQFYISPYGGISASIGIAFALNLEGTRNLYGGEPVDWY